MDLSRKRKQRQFGTSEEKDKAGGKIGVTQDFNLASQESFFYKGTDNKYLFVGQEAKLSIFG